MTETPQKNSSEIRRLQTAISALEEKRNMLGDDVVETALAPLREKLNRLQGEEESRERKLRKYVTVIFADISDFTSICGPLDAEIVSGTLNRLWKALDRIIIQHGGVIDKHIGDAVMALWGTERVMENDTENAVRAALEMQAFSENFSDESSDDLPNFRMRVAVHSGPVFLSNIGVKSEFTALGDTVNVASRLQSSAPLGSVVVSQESYRNVKHSFTFRPRDAVKVKGISEPLKSYEVISSRPKVFQQINTGILGIRTNLVGRERELDLLTEILSNVMDDEKTRMVTIKGEAGIGKSRLLHEFRNRVEKSNADIIFFNARCTPEMQNVPCAVFRDILKYGMNVLDDDTTENALAKFLEGMGEHLSREEILLACHYAGFDFSSYETVSKLIGNSALATEGRSALIRYFREVARNNRTLMYLEDLHWADSTSLDIVEKIAGEVRNASLMIIVLARPPLFRRRPSWGQNAPNVLVELEPLSSGECRDMIRDILRKVEKLPSDISELLVSNAEGNPFYLEELISMLVDEGVIEPSGEKWQVRPEKLIRKSVPSTLTGVLQARLDSLTKEEKELLQKASVIGRMFWDLAVKTLYEQKVNR
ncbi:MAG: AAA family ATPase, partial [Candidatus Aegiribacteria sp.]|nr:AAA family ATPase [Candidatus Aegiribacteria sp.]MBD3294996.1 AAA family ATPase [Candidatus Fermentibacteria bacterium]